MLSFKFLFAMIIESYKKNHQGKRDKSMSVFDELAMVQRKLQDNLRALTGKRCVPMEHIAIALKNEPITEDNSTVPTSLNFIQLESRLKRAYDLKELKIKNK